MTETPAIRVENASKAFRIPTERLDSLKERVVRPFAHREFRVLEAVRDVSFEVGRGEFFGIVGRNGSGKSTLLKLLASIYRVDAGRIQVAGGLAPFIELGIGFNHELTARENIVLNGVMMGVPSKEMRSREESVVDFAELHDFADLKLKNYSSGMLVRLAFAAMMEVDADVLLIDEVLAVGDASFQQKCVDAFHRMKAEGKTIVLVTHDMGAVEEHCNRAMLMEDGEIVHIGEPAEVGREYLRRNFSAPVDDGEAGSDPAEGEQGFGARLVRCRVENGEGEEVSAVELGESIHLRAEVELTAPAPALQVGFGISNADGITLAEFGTTVIDEEGELEAGRRVEVSSSLENPFGSGRHIVHCGIQSGTGISTYVAGATSFVIIGMHPARGAVAPKFEFRSEFKDRPPVTAARLADRAGSGRGPRRTSPARPSG